MKQYAVLATLIIIAAVSVVEAAVKSWKYDWNLESVQNWRGGNPNCGNTHAVLPTTLDYTTFVGSAVSFASLYLPVTGEIVFGVGGSITVGPTLPKRRDCPTAPHNISWNHFGKDNWWDPGAWSIPEHLKADEKAVPDVHRVPCGSDLVILPDPSKHLSPIHFTPPAVYVTSITIKNKNYSTSEFMDYSVRNVSEQLTGYSDVRHRAMLYAEEAVNCLGGRDCKCSVYKEVNTVVCSAGGARGGECGGVAPACTDPILMQGFCCPSCGVDMTIPSSYPGRKSDLDGVLRKIRKTQEGRQVSSYAGLMSDDLYHVFLKPKTGNADYKTVANMVLKEIREVVGDGTTSAIVLLSSGEMTSKVAQNAATAAIVSVLLLLAVAALLYFAYKKGYVHVPSPSSSSNFRFRRMSMVAFNRMSRISLQSDALSSRRPSDITTTASSTDTSYNPSTGLRFSNPVFSKSTASLAAMPIDPEGEGPASQDEPSVGGEGASASSHENPMYSAYMHMTPDEKKATDYTCHSPAPQGAAPKKPPRLEDKTTMRFSQLGTIEEDLQSLDHFSGGDNTKKKTSADETDPVSYPQTSITDANNETKIVIDVPGFESDPEDSNVADNLTSGIELIDVVDRAASLDDFDYNVEDIAIGGNETELLVHRTTSEQHYDLPRPLHPEGPQEVQTINFAFEEE
uniref:Protein amnionless n=1 Tax=Hirondellea gigas TaxID=1518452 RepID=A0A6A7G2T7_9CRUS